jgi:hypothetical protein
MAWPCGGGVNGGNAPIKYHPKARLLDENMVDIPSSSPGLVLSGDGPSFCETGPINISVHHMLG